MPSNNQKIVVAGDVTVDWYFWTRFSDSNVETEDINWKLYDGLNMCHQLAGAILLSDILKEIYPNNNIRDQRPEGFDQSKTKCLSLLIDPRRIIHTNLKLDLFPSGKLNINNKIYRVKTYLGVTTPAKNKDFPDQHYPNPLGIVNDDEDADLVVLHDIGNGFRDKSQIWPKAITEDKKPIIIHYMNIPLFRGDLWKYLIEKHNQRVILIINAEDLRKLGAHISRSISWEKTALDFLWEVNNNKKLVGIKNLPNVVVRFGLEGAIHYKSTDKGISSKLYFDPSSVEEGFWDSKKFGSMKGISAVFVSSLTSKLISDSNGGKISDEALKEGIEFGLLKSREFMKIGHGYDNNKKGLKNRGPIFFSEIYKNLFPSGQKNNGIKNDHIECVELPRVDLFEKPDPNFWSILEEKTKDGNRKLVDVAIEIVKKGSSALRYFPVGYFGKLTTVDRAEIESFRSIMNIMEEYINSEKASRPLSVAVFGYPGSGKSFGITEVAKTIDSEHVEKIVFNVSQFTSITDLTSAFHRIRDISLKGKIPLVFFDEFDCTFENKPLGWLRYFLVPMQDGEFMDNGSMHPIGRSIFVFAGGVYKDFQQFCYNIGVDYNTRKESKENQKLVSENLPPEKCPDFVSRLRGYVNILGPNKIGKSDNAYIIRRAIILRSLIEEKAPNIITTKKESDYKESDCRIKGIANIDLSLLESLLKIEEYKHGARSMEAIIDMSMLRKHKSWEKASLPPNDQLEIHIGGKEFSELMAKN